MNYENPELLQRLAAEYVLGTQSERVRRRFERVLDQSQAARDALAFWREELADIAQLVEPEAPPARVWRNIEARLRGRSRARASWLSVWAITATLLLAVVVAQRQFAPVETAAPMQVSFVNESNLTPLWVVSIDTDTGTLHTRAISAQAQELDKVYELWMLPGQGNPRSLGLMPVDGASSTTEFSPALLDLLANAQGLAVSIEPAGGSPTGVPTGPVVYQAGLYSL